MSVIRSGLRTQRLKKEDNFMAYDPELFQGHELDWLALRLDQRHPCSKEPSVNAADFRSRRLWLVYSHPLRRDIRNTAASISCTAHQQQASDVIERLIPIDSKSGNIIGFRIKNQDAYNDNAELVQARVEKEFQEQLAKIYNSECDTTGMPAESWEQPSRIAKAYFYRSRLARMTGVGQPQSDQSSHWGTRFVPVREMANKLADAIEETMNTLFQPQFDPPPVLQESWDQSFAILWAVPCCLEDDFGVAPETGHIYLTIRRRPDQLPSSVWTTDRSEIESVLGLWLWSLENTLERQNAREAGAKKGDETMNRIVHANDTWATSSGDLVNLDIWRERSNCQFRAWRLQKQDLHSPPQVSISMNTTIDLPWEHMRNSFDIRSPRGQNETWWKNGDDYVFHTTGPPADWVDKKRFFGWTNMVSESTDNPVHVLEIESKLSLEANCAQELYSIFLSSIMKITHDIGGHTKAEKYQGGLKASNECIDSIQAAIIQTGLCDKNDAFACTIPILGRLGHLKISDEVLTAALEIAENYLRLGKWDDAGRYFSWILDQSVFRFTSKNEAKMTLKSTEATNNFRLSLLRVCETSRRALLQDNHSARMFGYRQILELLHRFASTENIISLRLVWSDIGTLPNSEVTGHQLTMSDVIQCYGNVALRCLETKRSPSRDEIRLRGNLESIIQLGHCADSIVTAINNSDLSSTLYLLERVHFPEPHRSRGFIMACKKGWYMVVEILIKIGANIHFEDQGRTALSYSSEYGDINIVRLLIRSGAELRSKSNTSYEPERFPCHYAAENGHATIIDAMVQEWKSSSEMDREDDRNMTPLSLAITYGNPSTVRALLSRGSWVDANHYHTKKPALHLAIAIGREDMVEVLLQCSTVDPNHSHGATIDCPPLVLALKKNQESMFDMILAASNVNADCEDNQGRTALWWAASLNRKSYVYKLLDSGKVCLPDKADRSGRTALSVATEAGSTDICSLLREFETMH
ncbi:hypothetical protein FPOAC1_012600 [Fusarium poae]|uniref:hypothetical protein n=1 Tax=Fusarium poae TaxID=36050 RepID=UPI001CE873DE|nr:hypothetical protein FPOAC1_012600 [Fusarium poae]KAG8667761.1 hypothetical protein FPOAC1_012600 [Fusarium poae]